MIFWIVFIVIWLLLGYIGMRASYFILVEKDPKKFRVLFVLLGAITYLIALGNAWAYDDWDNIKRAHSLEPML